MRIGALALALAVVCGCRPSTVADAEARGEVTWLDNNGSAEAVSALGRLADTKPKALDALQKRSAFDVNAYIAAWVATKRGQTWGPALLKLGLADPNRAEAAASAMPRRDPLLAGFVIDIEGALSRLAAGTPGVSLGGLLASVGPPAHAAVERRMKDGASRGAMCAGLSTPDASPDARSVLYAVPPEARDNASCINTVVAMAQTDDTAIAWLGSTAEPGLLSSVAKNPSIPCARIHSIWERALQDRAPQVYAGLTVPISLSIKRCSLVMDSVLADGLTRLPAVRATIVQAIDPYGGETHDLKETCKALVGVASGKDSPIVRERANDQLQHGCRGLP